MYFRDADATIVIYDCTSNETFVDAKKWLKDFRMVAPEDASITVVGNKCDLVDEIAVSMQTA
jgi:GTPase SAR1 family protein